MNELRAIDATGDTKMIWSPDNADEVAAARASFDALKKKGYIAYSVKPGGEKGEVLAKFDANAEKVIMVPAMQGG